MNLLRILEEVHPEVFFSILDKCGVRLVKARPKNGMKSIVIGMFENGDFLPGLYLVILDNKGAMASYRRFETTSRLFKITLKKLLSVLKATRYSGPVVMDCLIDLEGKETLVEALSTDFPLALQNDLWGVASGQGTPYTKDERSRRQLKKLRTLVG